MLAVVGKQVITVLADPRARSLNHFLALELARRLGFDPHGAAARESRQRDFFDWTAMQTTPKSGVMHDLASAHVDPVM
jgi:hypothetical protein